MAERRRPAIGLAVTLLLASCATHAPPPRPQPLPRVQQPLVPGPVVRTPLPAPKPSKPAWTARKVVADAVDVPGSSVSVAAGDSLARIAARTGTSAGAIAAANGLAPPYALVPGRTLDIPAGRYHRVKDGETGVTIARAYGVAWDTIITGNRLAPPYALQVGQRLLLPSRRAVAAMSLEQRAKAFRLNIDDLITGSEPATVARPARAAPTPTPRVAAPRPAAPAPLLRPPIDTGAAAGRFAWPLAGRIVSAFGAKPGGRYNDGVNLSVPAGTPVHAAADGVVAYAGSGIEGFGGLVLIKHDGGWVTAYAHNEALGVARGDAVKKGQIIARSGATGSVDEPQLHFEIRRGRTPVDPVRLLGAPK